MKAHPHEPRLRCYSRSKVRLADAGQSRFEVRTWRRKSRHPKPKPTKPRILNRRSQTPNSQPHRGFLFEHPGPLPYVHACSQHLESSPGGNGSEVYCRDFDTSNSTMGHTISYQYIAWGLEGNVVTNFSNLWTRIRYTTVGFRAYWRPSHRKLAQVVGRWVSGKGVLVAWAAGVPDECFVSTGRSDMKPCVA